MAVQAEDRNESNRDGDPVDGDSDDTVRPRQAAARHLGHQAEPAGPRARSGGRGRGLTLSLCEY